MRCVQLACPRLHLSLPLSQAASTSQQLQLQRGATRPRLLDVLQKRESPCWMLPQLGLLIIDGLVWLAV